MHRLLKRKPRKIQLAVLYALVLLNLGIHFAGPFVLWENPDHRLARMFMVNICAVIVLLAPALFFSKGTFLKSGFVLSSIMAGALVTFYPSEALGFSPFSLAAIRFYIQHFLIFSVAASLVSLRFVKLRYRDFWALPAFMFLSLLIVVANGAILEGWGVIGRQQNWNMAFQWGPAELEGVIGWLVPGILRTGDGFIPVLWQLPVFFTFYPAFALATVYLSKKLGN
ncbi:MAG: cytochrome ubiquinol oxidase subunit I [Turicibacter sp.]|nr:cytochrome ubiquinol oxidase subunit I [Turicibacter sp.]